MQLVQHQRTEMFVFFVLKLQKGACFVVQVDNVEISSSSMHGHFAYRYKLLHFHSLSSVNAAGF